ncbi:CPBP family intramembrane glutamic endopeptidase [Paenibacillus sp. LHD-117]|uniref:CPBP family intramembrane glutamic endopeptidase n=1 Tax=Paenibacillus sp. LHD-117 TaxID=3071412 RepID=UPI0027E06EE6|nr:CPBP family intramembrane glutamic endopeptidase [Paenibacillus sp. LHD-117]MDQ6419897.1 CPBP family intramembrane glutamic endopeptidase [Paenibacillus sp. LHD-117]
MTEIITRKEWKRYVIAAAVLGILFVLLEIVPMILSVSDHKYGGKVIDKGEIEEMAVRFAESETGYAVREARTVHQSDKLLSGYLSKEKLTQKFEDDYGNRFATDTFQVNLKFADRKGSGFVYLNMYTGDVLAWNLNAAASDSLSEEEKREQLQSFLLGKQYKDADLESLTEYENGEWGMTPEGIKAGEADLNVTLQVQSVNGKSVITMYKPVFDVPEDYKSYVKGQDRLAGWLTGIGYLLMSVILGILAIVYSILYRKFTSFKYGWLLTVVFTIAYLIMNLSVFDGMIAAQGESPLDDGVLVFTAVITVLLTVPMAASVYLSIVAGDGLWKEQGRQVWPRLGQPGYGDYVWRSMGLSYLLAVILLGIQPLIFRALELIIGTWGTSDVTMSPYNFSVLWLMPVLAWAAAISEEAVFRFFGIGLFRKWFRHTFAAAILPTLFWSLGHVMYPFYPSTTRLFELMVIGLLFSFIFVRYGFITAMFTHAIFNSIAVGSSLIMVGGAPNIVSAIFFVLLPVLIAYVLRAWDRKKKRTNPPITSTVYPLEPQ